MKLKRIYWLPVVPVLMLWAGLGYAATPETTEPAKADWRFHDIVDVAFVQPYAKVPQPEGVLIIDSRPYKPKYVNGHIPTAVNIPDSQFDKMSDKLPKDKNTLLIFYCEGFT